MGDSDDEYDRKRRDKFRGERAEASYRGVDRPIRARDEWQERDQWSRRPRGDYRGAPRDRGYSPSIEPAAKRMRHDYYAPYDAHYNHYQPYHQPPHREPVAAATPEGMQPPMMSFKAFLAAQDDNISDSEAVEKYNDYKLEFQRQQLNEFFVAHKDDEWFRLKYHPEDSVKRKDEQMNALKKRVSVFLDLLDNSKFEEISVDCSRTDDLVRLLDTVVIKLEGGTDADLAVLYQEPSETNANSTGNGKSIEVDKENNGDSKGDEGSDIQEITDVDKSNEEGEIKEETNGNVINTSEETEQDNSEKPENDVVDNENDSNTKEDDAKSIDSNKMEDEVSSEKNEEGESVAEKETTEVEEEKTVENEPVEKKRKKSFSGSESSSSDSEEGEETAAPAAESPKPESIKDDNEDETKSDTAKETEPKPEPPKALHKTTSIFLRNLSPTITKQEVEAMCSRYTGFLRVALADPQPERRWLRRGWVTFTRGANIKEICWNLNNIRLRDCELGAIVNRDLSRRIRQVNGITAHKTVVRSDIRISAKVALHLDSKSNLWVNEEEEKKEEKQTFGLVSNNPVLKNITDYLIEEASAEEEELLGLESSTDQQDTSGTVDRDETLIKVLDKIILYLRIVHSVDYYNHCEYPNEDEMPNRCGILHARGPPPLAKTDMTSFLGLAVEGKMSHFLPDKTAAGGSTGDSKTDKLVGMALKDEQAEIDKFVLANTRELAKDKWLCPLSGKKFKGPDFVRKHIFNKHGEKVEEVKKEVQFFNNYLKDPKRPMLAEQQPTKREETPAFSHPGYAGLYAGYGVPSRGGYFNQGYGQRSRGFSRSRGGSDYRPVVHYRDLDAPREPEEFI